MIVSLMSLIGGIIKPHSIYLLNNNSPTRYFTEMLIDIARRNFDVNWTHASIFEKGNIIFADYQRLGEKVYEEVTDFARLSSVLEKYLTLISYLSNYSLIVKTYLESYNISSHGQMKLVFFTEVIMHISRITRILHQERGSALLVGVDGCGKKSLARLASRIPVRY